MKKYKDWEFCESIECESVRKHIRCIEKGCRAYILHDYLIEKGFLEGDNNRPDNIVKESEGAILDIKVFVKGSEVPFHFDGRFLRESEKPNWHYYRSVSGWLYHFRKDHIVAVVSKNMEKE